MRKHFISLLLALAVCAGLLCVPAYASSGDFTIEDGVLTEYHGSGGDVTIPDGVTVIGSYAFNGCKSLTSVTIPNSVTEIGDGAFWDCSSLTSVTIPNSVTKIGDSAFNLCSSLTSVTIPDSVTEIGGSAFQGTPWLSSLGDFAVVNNILLRYQGDGGAVTIPDGVTEIGLKAFLSCSSLTSVTIPSGVTTIGDIAFAHCKSLTSVTIPDSVTEIGEYAFYGCSSLTSVTIPNSVTKIGDSAFNLCSSLTSVTIPNSVTKIGDYAFSSTPWLKSLMDEAGDFVTVNSILLDYQGSGTDITIPSDITAISGGAFDGCSSLTSVTVPDSVTEIGRNAFSGCFEKYLFRKAFYMYQQRFAHSDFHSPSVCREENKDKEDCKMCPFCGDTAEERMDFVIRMADTYGLKKAWFSDRTHFICFNSNYAFEIRVDEGYAVKFCCNNDALWKKVRYSLNLFLNLFPKFFSYVSEFGDCGDRNDG